MHPLHHLVDMPKTELKFFMKNIPKNEFVKYPPNGG